MLVLVRQWTNDHCVSNARSTQNQLRVDRNHRSADGNCLLQICAFFCLLLDEYIHHLGKDRNRSNIGNVVSSRVKNKNCQLKDIIYISLKIKPNSFRIRSLSCQIFVLTSTGFEFTPLIHCSNNRLSIMSSALDHSVAFAIYNYSFNSRSVTLSHKENLEIDIRHVSKRVQIVHLYVIL